MASTVRLWFGRLGLILLGLLAGAVLVETVLRVGALATGSRQIPTTPAQWQGSTLRILALGDSNTYGLYVGRSAAYPRIFEQMWNQQALRPRIEVLNLGYPGTNSSQVLAEFDRYMTVLRPDIVTLMVGANDAWTQPVPTDAEASFMLSLRQWLWRSLRIYRLGYMIARAWENATLEVVPLSDPADVSRGHGIARFGGHQFVLGHRMDVQRGQANWAQQADARLRKIVEAARRWDVSLVLLTYPSGHFIYGAANDVLRQVAESTGTPFVDVNREFQEFCPDWKCEELFPDQHPTELGHVRVAQALMHFFNARLGSTSSRLGR